ncbi:MAG: SDR family oxidoreductase [Peptococcaceae bacterium]|nr:SDR family oxidoreductase [Peptococcaceae bacterium]
MKRLEGKIALITGAASGLGRAMAQRFAEEGAFVIITDINLKGLAELQQVIETSGGHSESYFLNVSNQNDWQNVLIAVRTKYGKLNILVNNAGYVPLGNVENVTIDSLKNAFDVMVFGPILGMQTMLPLMKETDEACAILNVSSVCGAYVATANNLAYNTAKSAVLGMTKAVAVDLARTNIRVNTIHPGTIEHTAISDKVLQGDNIKIKLSKIPLGRFGEPREVADTALFLCSDEASYIHGASIVIDGGQILGYRDSSTYV